MSRFITAFGLVIAFLVWVFYRLFIKKDLKQHLNDLYTGLFFIAVWFLLYWFFTH